MKITAPAALSRLAVRFNERRARAAQGERPPLTKDDEDNIAGFIALIDALCHTLDRENDALRGGDVDMVVELFEEKQAHLQRMELRQPVIEPFLRESVEVTGALRERLRGLAQRLEENAGLLQSMAAASQIIRGEVQRVRDRHSLKGMYDKAGQARETPKLGPKIIDGNF